MISRSELVAPTKHTQQQHSFQRNELTMVVWMIGVLRHRLGGHGPASVISWNFRVSKHFRCGFVTLDASQFKHLWEDSGTTASFYNGHPLAQLNGPRRGVLLQEWACQILRDANPKALFKDAIPGTRINGWRRSAAQAEYDFQLGDRKGEVKSSQLQWVKNQWRVLFKRVKFPHLMSWNTSSFQDLYLVLFSPKWLHLVKHDLQTGISKAGLETDPFGLSIHIGGSTNSLCWEESLQTILNKLCTQGGCSLIAKTDISETCILDMCNKHQGFGRQFYYRKPFSSMSPQLRGLRMQRIVWKIDKLLHSRSFFEHCSNEHTCSGSMRGQNNASVDWIRDGKRVEAKSTQLSFSKCQQAWLCQFSAIKHDCFDELLLAIYSPRGLDVFKHDGFFGLSTRGVATDTCGKSHICPRSFRRVGPATCLEIHWSKVGSEQLPSALPGYFGMIDPTEVVAMIWRSDLVLQDNGSAEPDVPPACGMGSPCWTKPLQHGIQFAVVSKWNGDRWNHASRNLFAMTIDYKGLFMRFAIGFWLAKIRASFLSHGPPTRFLVARNFSFSECID